MKGPLGLKLVGKAVAAIAFRGGLTIAEVKGLKCKNVQETDGGFWVEYIPVKQRGEVKTARFFYHRTLLSQQAAIALMSRPTWTQ